jgi:integrase
MTLSAFVCKVPCARGRSASPVHLRRIDASSAPSIRACNLKSLGLENVRFHDLRHTFAVNSLKAGDDIKTVQENLGHHTASFTLDVYAHVTGGMKQDSAKRMELYLQRVTG